jgi:hypothetical protein
VAAVAGCTSNRLGACDVEPDLTGQWTMQAGPFDGDAGVMGDVVPRSFTVDANLSQMKSTATLGIGAAVWGTLTSRDKGVFDVLQIPQLKMNDGSKTGAELGCTVKINVPIAMPVTDDDMDQGPLRIALVGAILQKGMMLGDPETSLVIFAEDTTNTPKHFAWTATQQ